MVFTQRESKRTYPRFSQLEILSTLTLVIFSLTIALRIRPIQDDYFNIESVQKMGVWGYLVDTWNSHGGNMAQFAIHSLLVTFSTDRPFFYNFSLFILLTEVLVAYCSFLLIKFIEIPVNRINFKFWIPFISVIGFEGVFVPGFLGAYGFSLASLAHLWPILALILGIALLTTHSNFRLLVIPLGFIAGNSNISESLFCCLVMTFAIYNIKERRVLQSSFRIKGNAWTFLFYSAMLIGTCMIPAAPGFWNRAADQVGLPNSFGNFLFRLAKSLTSFTADVLTHPAVYLAFLVGLMVAHSSAQGLSRESKNRILSLCIFALIFLLLLIIGSTIAYPAWHQSSGLYMIVIPAVFHLGVLVGDGRELSSYLPRLKFLTFFLIFLLGAMYVRVGVASWQRSSHWDSAFKENVCSIATSTSAPLLGAEIIYPPFKLGVEDVNTWPWMANKYRLWVSDSNFKSGVNCP